jgi:hypothetical protein
MNQQKRYRPLLEELAITPELVTPLSGPSHGVFNVAKRRWRKPLPAIIADAIANSEAVLARLQRGMYMPDLENKPHYQAAYNAVCECTREQLAALQAFAAIEWRE